ncbi:hypothetical protein DM01DRAFT_1383558 [Hesseltinella vesiculosa]|uniref:Uncharacterized protein n=1 Tax=Hesseltinella vesiculosa TaxID=101127 RepID=A0A1X2GGW4_9FUNG|nr:hypothetical protein DM01DRAFT_1383558 [Hesseltinella vesiculosa]
MRHLFGKEHKEQKSLKLVKKLQLEEDRIYQQELTKRVQQEEDDAAFARQLQAELENEQNNNTTTTPSPIVTSLPIVSTHPLSTPSPVTPPVHHRPASFPSSEASPPPLPAKPSAYVSASGSSPSSHSTLTSERQPTREVPPPPYQTTPRLPPRERTVSQVSQTSMSNISPPTTNGPARHSVHSGYNPGLNTAMTPGLGNALASPAPFQVNTPHMYSSTPIPHSQPTPQMHPTPVQQRPRREPAMLIIPPPKEINPPMSPVHHAQAQSLPTSMPMPGQMHNIHPPVIATSASVSAHPPSMPAFIPPAPFTSLATPPTLLAVAQHPPHPPHPPHQLQQQYHSAPTSSIVQPSLLASSYNPKKTNANPIQKPDTKLEKPNSHSNSASPATSAVRPLHRAPTKYIATDKDEEEVDDDDDLISFTMTRSDGHMMTNSATNAKDDKARKRPSVQQYSLLSLDSDDSGVDDDDTDDLAIDPFDINPTDNVIIHQHNGTATTTALSRRSSKLSLHQPGLDDDNESVSTGDPFADSHAIHGAEKIEPRAQAIAKRQSTGGLADLANKSAFQMSQNVSTLAKVHDPLLRLAGASASSVTLPARPSSTQPWSFTQRPESAIPRSASAFQHTTNHAASPATCPSTDDLVSLDDNVHPIQPTNVVRAGAPPNFHSMISQVTAEVPANEFGYYRYATDQPGGEKEEITDDIIKDLPVLPELPKTDPDHRHITVPSVIEDQRVWIRVHPTDTGKSLAARIQIVASYKTRKVTKITTDKGRVVPLDDSALFPDWADVMRMTDGTAWKIEWVPVDNSLWEGPKDLLRFLKTRLRGSS